MKRTLDSYGLPGQFRVRLTENTCGDITLTPICKKWEKRVGKSNLHNGEGTVFIQNAYDTLDDWRNTLPKVCFYRNVMGNIAFNDNVVFMMDSWTFRHLCGGQCD